MITFSQRAEKAQNPVAQALFRLMERKKTNLCVAADLTTKEALLEFIDTVGPHICLLKVMQFTLIVLRRT